MVAGECKCGDRFCKAHRHAHDCPFDYKGHAREALRQANPVIKPTKLEA